MSNRLIATFVGRNLNYRVTEIDISNDALSPKAKKKENAECFCVMLVNTSRVSERLRMLAFHLNHSNHCNFISSSSSFSHHTRSNIQMSTYSHTVTARIVHSCSLYMMYLFVGMII